jgi:hypothetical protein
MAGACGGPETLDHGEHPVVAGQKVHHHRRHASRLGAGEQGAQQCRSHTLVLPGVGHHQADIGHPDAVGSGPVRGHGVPDDDVAPGSDHGGGGAGAPGQEVEQGRAGCDRAEEPQVAGLHGQSREEVAERGQVRRAHRADRGGHEAAGRAPLGSIHRLSIPRSC